MGLTASAESVSQAGTMKILRNFSQNFNIVALDGYDLKESAENLKGCPDNGEGRQIFINVSIKRDCEYSLSIFKEKGPCRGK